MKSKKEDSNPYYSSETNTVGNGKTVRRVKTVGVKESPKNEAEVNEYLAYKKAREAIKSSDNAAASVDMPSEMSQADVAGLSTNSVETQRSDYKPIENPLPVPKKKEHKPIDYKEKEPKSDTSSGWDYDYDVDDNDDFDF